MNPRNRKRFDALLESVLAELPPVVHRLLEEVPLHVEDHPARPAADDDGVDCGEYVGVSLDERSIQDPYTLPSVITIYREGVVDQARGEDGRVSVEELRRQIRITILHELGHHHGMTEEELRRLGYE